jgi:hypothetical protein
VSLVVFSRHKAVAADVGDAFPLEKLPKELRRAIYEAVYKNTLARSSKMVSIMEPGFLAGRNLLRVNRQIRHEVQEILQERMGRQVIFNATCWSRDDEVEAAGRAQSLYHGNVVKSG